MNDILQGGETLRQLIGRSDLGNAFYLFDLRRSLLKKAVVLQRHHIAVPQILSLHTVEGTVALMLGQEIIQCLLPGNKFSPIDIVYGIELGADALGFRVGKLGVHIDQNLICFVQILNHQVDVVNQAEKAAHDQQAGHRNTHSGKGHKSVEEDAANALFEQITDIIDFHFDNNRPFRR